MRTLSLTLEYDYRFVRMMYFRYYGKYTVKNRREIEKIILFNFRDFMLK